MIEPQNTTMPLPAASAQPEAPQGDGAGFGEMLAQSLGMAAAVDPNAVQQISADAGDQSGEQSADLFSTEAEQEQVVDNQGRLAAVNRSRASADPTQVLLASAPAASSAPAQVADRGVVADEIVNPPVSKESPPDRTLPKPVVPMRGSHTAALVDGLGKPVLTEVNPPLADHVAPPKEAGPVDSIGVPVLTAEPPVSTNPSVTAEQPHLQPVVVDGPPISVGRTPAPPETPSLPPQPRPMADTPPPSAVPADPTATEPMRSVDPSLLRPESLDPAPQRREPSRRTPVTPTPTVAESVAPRVTEARPDHVAWPAAATPRVDLGVDTAVSFKDPQVPFGKASAAVPIAVSTEPAVAAAEPVPVSIVDAPSVQPAAAGVASHVEPIPGSALAARVMRAVEMQANQPPPRTMIVDIPEIEGLRLIVSVRGGAQVHVVPTTGSLMNDGFQSFMDELSGVLADRGFEMTGEGRQRGSHADQQDEQQTPFPMQRPTIQRPTRSDNDLRI